VKGLAAISDLRNPPRGGENLCEIGLAHDGLENFIEGVEALLAHDASLRSAGSTYFAFFGQTSVWNAAQ
jgi:hypothetical protein